MKENRNTVDNCVVAIKNVEIEDVLVQADTRDSQGNFSLSTLRKRKEDRKQRVIGSDNLDKSAIQDPHRHILWT